MSKKYILVFFVCMGLLASSANAGPKPKWPCLRAKQPVISAHTQRLNALLQKRVMVSFQKANQLQGMLPTETILIDSYPFTTLTRPLKNPEKLYPAMENFLTTDQQWSDYLLASQNRHFRTELFRAQRQLDSLRQNFEDLYQNHAHVLDPSYKNHLRLLAAQIPGNTRYLLIGEAHEPAIRHEVTKLLPKIRQKFPAREIVLLTEFLEEGPFIQEAWTLSADMEKLLKEAVSLDMNIIGLEPKFCFGGNEAVACKSPKGAKPAGKTQALWESLEGIALRNQYWMEIIKKAAQDHPDALFIIYAGIGHTAYDKPFSIGRTLASENTFVISLAPDNVLSDETDFLPVSPYDALTFEQELVIHPFVKFDKPYAEQVGFDVRYFVEDE